MAVLDPDVELTSDGGGVVSAARRPVLGADSVARFLLGLTAKYPDVAVVPAETGDGLGFVMVDDGQVTGVMTFSVRDGAVSGIRMVRNPEKLTLWG